MALLFQLIALTSIWVLGLTIVTQEGMLLYSIREWAEKKKEDGYVLTEPLILCHWCMPSLHGVMGYIFALAIGILSNFRWELVVMYPLVVMGSSLVNGLIWSAYRFMAEKTEYYKNINDSFYEEDDIRQINY